MPARPLWSTLRKPSQWTHSLRAARWVPVIPCHLFKSDSVRNASFLLSAILLFMVWFVLISWCCVYDTYNIPCIITSSREVRCICHAQLVVNVFVSDHSYLSLVSFSLILPLCHAALCLQSVWPWASSYTSPGNVRNAWPPFSHLISFLRLA